MKKVMIAVILTMAIGFVGCSKEEVKVDDKPVVEDTNTDAGNNDATDSTKDEVGENGTTDDGATDEIVTDQNINEEEQKVLDAIRDAVANAYEEYIPNMPYTKEQIKEWYGIDETWYDAVIAEGPMISAHVDTFLAFHPTEGNLENIKAALETYKEYLINDSFQYPMNMDKVKAATILEDGENIYFIMLGLIDDSIVDEGERLKAFEEENKIAVEAIKAYK